MHVHLYTQFISENPICTLYFYSQFLLTFLNLWCKHFFWTHKIKVSRNCLSHQRVKIESTCSRIHLFLDSIYILTSFLKKMYNHIINAYQYIIIECWHIWMNHSFTPLARPSKLRGSSDDDIVLILFITLNSRVGKIIVDAWGHGEFGVRGVGDHLTRVFIVYYYCWCKLESEHKFCPPLSSWVNQSNRWGLVF